MLDGKFCTKCRMFKTFDQFKGDKRRRNARDSWCRSCNGKSGKTTKRSNQSIITQAKNAPCKDCGIRYPAFVMDFDHRDPSQKKFELSAAGKTASLRRLREEMSKCDLVCANCHRIRTHSLEGSVAPVEIILWQCGII